MSLSFRPSEKNPLLTGCCPKGIKFFTRNKLEPSEYYQKFIKITSLGEINPLENNDSKAMNSHKTTAKPVNQKFNFNYKPENAKSFGTFQRIPLETSSFINIKTMKLGNGFSNNLHKRGNSMTNRPFSSISKKGEISGKETFKTERETVKQNVFPFSILTKKLENKTKNYLPPANMNMPQRHLLRTKSSYDGNINANENVAKNNPYEQKNFIIRDKKFQHILQMEDFIRRFNERKKSISTKTQREQYIETDPLTSKAKININEPLKYFHQCHKSKRSLPTEIIRERNEEDFFKPKPMVTTDYFEKEEELKPWMNFSDSLNSFSNDDEEN